MAKYEFVDENKPFKWIPPELQPGEKEIVINFQDKSCFTVNDYKSCAW